MVMSSSEAEITASFIHGATKVLIPGTLPAGSYCVGSRLPIASRARHCWASSRLSLVRLVQGTPVASIGCDLAKPPAPPPHLAAASLSSAPAVLAAASPGFGSPRLAACPPRRAARLLSHSSIQLCPPIVRPPATALHACPPSRCTLPARNR